MDIEAFRTFVTLAQFLWFALVALLAAAAVTLLVHAKARYGLAIAAFSCSGALALIWIVAVRAADSLAMGAVMDVLGPWAAFVVPHILEPTAWPWVVLACSACGVACVMRERRRARI